MPVRDLRACRVVDQRPPGRRRARCPGPRRPPCPRRRGRETSARRSGRSQTRPCVRPVSAPIGFVAALKITLRHCAGRASATARAPASRRGCRRRRAARSPRRGRGRGSNGPNVVSPFTSHWTTPGLEQLAGREGRAADHALDVLGERLLVADAVHHRGDGAVGERVRGGRDRRVGVHRLRRDDAEVARRELGRRRSSPAGARRTSPAPINCRPFSLIASTCAWFRSNAHTSTSSSVARFAANSEPTAPQPTTQILMQLLPTSRPPTRSRPGAGAGPELAPAGDPGRAQDEHERHQRAQDDEPRALRQVDREADADALLGLAQERVEAAHRERADHGAPEARDAADHEHRERHERELEVDLVGRDRAEHVDVEAAREPRERAGERERPQPLAVDVDAGRLRRGGILARRAQRPPEAAALVREGDRDHDDGRRSPPASGRSSPGRARASSRRARSSSTRAAGCA